MFRLPGLILAAAWACVAAPSAAQEFPALTGRVVDAADILPPEVEAQLTAKLDALETNSQRQLVVATIPGLNGYEISDYGYQLGRAWGIGQAEENNGIILLVAPTERKVRIEVGYGLEPIMTDGLSHLIIQNKIIPSFKAGDMPGGIVAGTDALIQQLQLPVAEAQQIAAQANEQKEGGGFPVGAIFWVMILLFFIVLPAMRGAKGSRRYRKRDGVADAVGQVILWNVIDSAMRGGGGGGHGGWGGGGGFSGGGGSFGGGGASGSW